MKRLSVGNGLQAVKKQEVAKAELPSYTRTVTAAPAGCVDRQHLEIGDFVLKYEVDMSHPEELTSRGKIPTKLYMLSQMSGKLYLSGVSQSTNYEIIGGWVTLEEAIAWISTYDGFVTSVQKRKFSVTQIVNAEDYAAEMERLLMEYQYAKVRKMHREGKSVDEIATEESLTSAKVQEMIDYGWN